MAADVLGRRVQDDVGPVCKRPEAERRRPRGVDDRDRPALAGDLVLVRTWVTDFRKVMSLRKYEFVYAADETVLAAGETDWVYIDSVTGRPRRIPPEIQGMFVLRS